MKRLQIFSFRELKLVLSLVGFVTERPTLRYYLDVAGKEDLLLIRELEGCHVVIG